MPGPTGSESALDVTPRGSQAPFQSARLPHPPTPRLKHPSLQSSFPSRDDPASCVLSKRRPGFGKGRTCLRPQASPSGPDLLARVSSPHDPASGSDLPVFLVVQCRQDARKGPGLCPQAASEGRLGGPGRGV